MDKDFDNLIRELVSTKKYTYNKSLLVKAKLGVKAAYTKALIIKSAIVASTVGTMSVAGVTIYNAIQPEAPTQAVVVNELVQDTTVHETQQDVIKENGNDPIYDYNDLVEALESETETREVEVLEPDISKPTVSEVTTTVDAREDIVKSITVEEQTNESERNTVEADLSQAKSIRQPVEFADLNIAPKNNYELSNSSPLSAPEHVDMTATWSNTPTWSVEIFVNEGSIMVDDNLASATSSYNFIQSNTQGMGLHVRKKIGNNWHIGSGIQRQNIEEEREYQTRYLASVNERIDHWQMDSILIREGWAFNPFSGRWEIIDTSFVHYWPVPGNITYDSIWATKTERITNRFKTISIPVHVSYALESGKWTLMPTLGVNIGRIYSLSYAELSGPLQEVRYFNTSELHANLVSFSAQASVQYRLTLRNYISAGISHNRSLPSFGAGNGLSLGTTSTRFEAGIGFKF
jgi:hypothetical protein